MPENKDIKRALDELLGEDLTADQLQNIQLFLKIGTWNRIEEGRVTRTSPLIPGKFCEAQKLLEVSGAAATGANGKVRFRLKEFICLDLLTFDYPINVVATPLASRPVFLTVKHSLVMNPANTFGEDVAIEVFTWDANGAAAPQIAFNWRCRVPFAETIF
jgi:hypothetical protein